jgi:cellulose synthase/poly-beta-1,6-N-acetylglucosamine synthase-like glycosyltransferase/peptidoglycan/xylan/chitin deacetylase (PgdA/CDA1 family)
VTLRAEDDFRHPRSHWLLLAVTLCVVMFLVLVAGFTHGQHGEGHHVGSSSAGSAQPPAQLRTGGPVVDAAHPDVPGRRVAARTIVLTFDDGPSSYTPEVLDVLARHHVPATFFVVGTQVAKYPDLLRRMIADGDEIGVHTFTHPHLGDTSSWRERLELDQTQQAIAAATGYTTDLLRLPYSSTPSAITASEWRAVTRAGSYLVTFTDLDTKDWATSSVDSIVAAATPPGNDGAVVMMHDGGGDRSATVAALERLIPQLQQRGFQFRTVTQAVGVADPWQPTSLATRLRGSVTIATVRASAAMVRLLYILFVVVGVLSVLRVLALLIFARRHARRMDSPAAKFAHLVAPAPSVTVIVPAYNEELGIAAAVRSLLANEYPVFEVIVVDDGSTDRTAAIVSGMSDERLHLIRQKNAGKSAALNTGIAAAQYGVIVMVDGDTVFEPATIGALVRPFADARVGAVSGNTKVGNRRGLLGRWQHIEYVIGFNLDRRMFDVLHCMPTVPGAIGAFRRTVLDQVGGVSEDTLAEDTDLTMAICRAGWRVVYEPSAIAWTEAPASLGQLWRQRYRWSYGTQQAMWKHRHAVVERGSSGKLGRRGLPYLLGFQVVLPLLAPVIDVAGLYGVFVEDSSTVAWTWLGFLAMQYLAAAYAFYLDRESPKPLWALALQQIVYRQVMYLVVIQSVASAIYGARLRWHKLRRTGELESAPVAVG